MAWLTPEDSDSTNTGHVMIMFGPPSRGPRPDEWLIEVADSTRSPHARDSRVGAAPTGLGTGVIGLVTDRGDRPVAYYWRGGASPRLAYTEIALGRSAGA